jgi:hypothetical protein
MTIETPFELNLAETATDKIQCSICGQPNIFGKLCTSCKAKLDELEVSDEETKRLYLALGLRCASKEFNQQGGE